MKLGYRNMTKQEKSWVLYDWANSVYATIMMAAVFPIYFTKVVNTTLNNEMGDYWLSIGTSVAMALVAVMAPIVGAFADYKGHKKKLFAGFLLLGLAFTLFSALTDQWPLMLLGLALSNVGFSGSNLVYDSFLPDVTTKERMDTVSGYGYALGYIGGSTIPFLISIGLIQFGDKIGLTGFAPVKLSIVIAVVWWGLFSIPFLKNIHQTHYVEKPQSSVMKETFRSILGTAKKIFRDKGIFYFILAYFFYIDGVGTVIHMSTAYGTTLGLNSTMMILALLVTQLVAFPCSIIFSNLSKKKGSLQMLTFAVCMYLGICIVGFIMGFGLEQDYFGLHVAQGLFWVLATMVGMVQGGIQAISRSHFAKLVPPENAGEFFGFFDIFGKFAAVMGPLLYAVTKSVTGRSSLSILSIILLFVAALVIMVTQRKHMQK